MELPQDGPHQVERPRHQDLKCLRPADTLRNTEREGENWPGGVSLELLQSAGCEGEDGLVIAREGEAGHAAVQLPPDLAVGLTPRQLDLVVGVEVLLVHTAALPGDVG